MIYDINNNKKGHTMANNKTKRTVKKKTGKQGRPGGNPDIEKYKWEPEVAGKPKRNLLPIKVDDDMFRVKQLPNWQDKVRAKIEELLQEAEADNLDCG